MDDGRVDGYDIADIAELGIAGRGRDEACVLAGEPDREGPMNVDRPDDVTVDLADEHHPRDVERLGVGDSVPAAELGHLAETRHERADLGSSAVHDDWEDPDRTEKDDVLGEALKGVRLLARPIRPCSRPIQPPGRARCPRI